VNIERRNLQLLASKRIISHKMDVKFITFNKALGLQSEALHVGGVRRARLTN
jgi:hypothetical protein